MSVTVTPQSPNDLLIDNDPAAGSVYPAPRGWGVTSTAPALTSGVMTGVFWRQPTRKPVNAIATHTRGTAATGPPSICKMALFGVDYDFHAETFTATQLAVSTNDTAMWAATFTGYEKSLTTLYLEAGAIYCASALCVTAGVAPQMYGTDGVDGDVSGWHPWPGVTIYGLTDMPASFTQATASTFGNSRFPVFRLRAT